MKYCSCSRIGLHFPVPVIQSILRLWKCCWISNNQSKGKKVVTDPLDETDRSNEGGGNKTLSQFKKKTDSCVHINSFNPNYRPQGLKLTVALLCLCM